jgi:hypothetical protein
MITFVLLNRALHAALSAFVSFLHVFDAVFNVSEEFEEASLVC